jgi:hypothetical protein
VEFADDNSHEYAGRRNSASVAEMRVGAVRSTAVPPITATFVSVWAE